MVGSEKEPDERFEPKRSTSANAVMEESRSIVEIDCRSQASSVGAKSDPTSGVTPTFKNKNAPAMHAAKAGLQISLPGMVPATSWDSKCDDESLENKSWSTQITPTVASAHASTQSARILESSNASVYAIPSPTSSPKRVSSRIHECTSNNAAGNTGTADLNNSFTDKGTLSISGSMVQQINVSLPGGGHNRSKSKIWINSAYIWWRHPWARILLAVLILIFDFFLYGEDPVNDSHVEANLPGLGHIISFCFRWPKHAGACTLRAVLILTSIFCGAYVGRQFLHHQILRDRCRLSMFKEDKGTILIMAVGVIIFLFSGAMIYNLLVPSGESAISGATGLQMREFGKLTQIFSVTADIIAIAQIVDAVLQDTVYFPDWNRKFKAMWINGCKGWFRVVSVWVVSISLLIMLVAGILSTGKETDDITWDNRQVGGLSEAGRTFLMSWLIFCDLFTVLQDWQFPTFAQPLHARILIAGTFVPELTFKLPAACEACITRVSARIVDFMFFTIDGKWLMYGPLFCVICVDLFCIRTQLFYSPSMYGQYVDPRSKRIWTIVDENYLSIAYKDGKLKRPELISWAARRSNVTGGPLDSSAATDVELNSQYSDSALKYVCALPGLVTLVSFLLLIWFGDRSLRRLTMSPSAQLELTRSSFDSE